MFLLGSPPVSMGGRAGKQWLEWWPLRGNAKYVPLRPGGARERRRRKGLLVIASALLSLVGPSFVHSMRRLRCPTASGFPAATGR